MPFSLINRENKSVLETQTKNYNGIDLFKFIGSILIFIIHIPIFKDDSVEIFKYINFGFQHYVCRIAVPFYFVSSGFFLFRKMSLGNLKVDVIKNYCFKIIGFYGLWKIILIVGQTGHLWYLAATVTAVVLLSLCLYFKIKMKNICILSLLLYFIGLIGDSYYGLIEPLRNMYVLKYAFVLFEKFFKTTRNGIFMGFIFILMGAILAHYNVRLSVKKSLIGLVVSMICLFAEVFLLKYNDIPSDYNMYVFLLPATFFLFNLACSIQLKDHIIYRHLRNIGMLIYFLHLLVDRFAYSGVAFVNKCFGVDMTKFHFIISLFLTIFIATFIELLSYKEKFKWIKWFIS